MKWELSIWCEETGEQKFRFSSTAGLILFLIHGVVLVKGERIILRYLGTSPTDIADAVRD